MGFEWSRPRAVGLDFSSNRFPWSAPWITNKEATEVSSPRLVGGVATRWKANHLQARLIDPPATVNPSPRPRRALPIDRERRCRCPEAGPLEKERAASPGTRAGR